MEGGFMEGVHRRRIHGGGFIEGGFMEVGGGRGGS